MPSIARNAVRDQNIDRIMQKVWVPAWDLVRSVGAGGTNPTTLTAGFSIGSPTYTSVPGSRHGAMLLTALTTTLDYMWRVPSEVDKNQNIYFRHHWTSQASGLTPTVAWAMVVATLSSASVLTSSPTAVLNSVVPASSGSAAAGTGLGYNLSQRGFIAPIATGLVANQVMGDTVEALHIAISAASANFTIASQNIFWLGMDIEYTPRITFGDGSRRPARKMETNLGFSEIGSVNPY